MRSLCNCDVRIVHGGVKRQVMHESAKYTAMDTSIRSVDIPEVHDTFRWAKVAGRLPRDDASLVLDIWLFAIDHDV